MSIILVINKYLNPLIMDNTNNRSKFAVLNIDILTFDQKDAHNKSLQKYNQNNGTNEVVFIGFGSTCEEATADLRSKLSSK